MALTRGRNGNPGPTTASEPPSAGIDESANESAKDQSDHATPIASAGVIPRRARTLIGGLALLGLAIMALLAILTIKERDAEGRLTAEHNRMLKEALQERSRVHEFYNSVQEAQKAELLFLLTGEPAFAETYFSTDKRIRAELAWLTSRLNVAPDDASHLQNLTHQMLAHMAQSIASYERRQSADVNRVMQASADADEIRTQLEQVVALRARAIEQHTAFVVRQARNSQERTSFLLGTFLTTAAIWLVFGFYFLQLREAAQSRLEAAMNKTEEARRGAEKANQSKTDFLAQMSHELRTPLASIIGFSELMLDDPPSLDRKRYINRIQVASSSLLTVIDDILDFSKIEAGALGLSLQPFSIASLLDNVVSIASAPAKKKSIPLEIVRPQGVPDLLVGDEPRLQQALLNLLNNAIKFADKGRVVLTVEHEGSFEDGEQIRFAVIDEGIGIAKAKQDKLFRVFSQLDQSITRRFGGTGLGLAISKRLIDLMGGQIGVESDEGQGATFWISVRLPRATESSTQFAKVGKRPTQLGRILLVEDLKQNQDLLGIILRTAGHEVKIASDGREAVVAVQREKFDLILMDVQMPGMDGLTATRTIRALDHAAKDIPIIAMTANVLPQQVAGFKASGMNDHIGKPCRRAELLEKVDNWLPVHMRTSATKPASMSDQVDATTFNEVRRLMGKKWIVVSLTKLDQQLEDLRAIDPICADREQLAGKAHTLVSHAAILGFGELSEAMSKLEEACRSGDRFQAALETVSRAADIARQTFPGILAQISGPDPVRREPARVKS